MPDATRQWLRFCQLVVGTGGVGLQVLSTHTDGFRISFTVTKTIRHTPNTANILIYNLHPRDEKKVLEEFEDVILVAGYQPRAIVAADLNAQGALRNPNQFGARVVFKGDIKRAFAWWDHSSGARVTEIQAADGHKAYREAVVNETLAAGSTSEAEVDAALRAMGATGGVTKGFVQVRAHARGRAKVISGSARQVLHAVASDNAANWSIQDGALHLLPSTGVLPNEAVVVNENTGMTDAPTISDKGVQVKCKLNPQITINGALKLNNDNIKIQEKQLYANGPKVKPKTLVRLSSDGVYKVFMLTHKGDTRGPEWDTVAEMVAVGQPIPAKGSKKAVVRIG